MTSIYRYAQDEITIPDGFSPEDLGWVGFSWSTYRPEGEIAGWPTHQCLLAPGVLSVRVQPSWYEENPFSAGSRVGTPFLYTHAEESNLCEFAQVKMSSMLENDGHLWDSKPFLVDFTEDEIDLRIKSIARSLYPDATIDNLGDALGCGVKSVLSLIYDHVARKRSEQETVLGS